MSRDTLDAMQADMADHQRRFGGEVSAEANRSLIAGELEQAERLITHATAAAPEVPAPIEKSIKNAQVDGRNYLLSREQDRPLLRVASPIEAEFMVRAEARMMQLLTLGDTGAHGAASWRDRVLAVMEINGKAAAWKAAAEAPEQLAQTRRTCEHDQALLKVFGLETISQLTPAFCRAKAAEVQQQFLAAFIDLLESSNLLFGDWKNPPGPKLVVGG